MAIPSLFQVTLCFTTEKKVTYLQPSLLKGSQGGQVPWSDLTRLFGYENFAEVVKELLFNVAGRTVPELRRVFSNGVLVDQGSWPMFLIAMNGNGILVSNSLS